MSNDTPEKPDSAKRQPLTPASRKRFQQLFVHAGKQAAQDNFDYATELFTQCVLGDLDNIAYWQSFFANLKKKYDNNKKGAKMSGLRSGGDKAALKKSQLSKDYQGVFRHGVEVLKLNPWDVSTLLAMHSAGESLELDEVPLLFLRIALDVAPNDVHVNRAAGHALRLRKQFDQAIACWHRVEEASKGNDQEAQKQIAELAVERTIDHGGYDGAETSREVKVEGQGPAVRQELSREESLKQAIRLDPKLMKNYVDLAEFYFQEERYADAESTLQEAYNQSKEDIDILDRLEDAQLRNLRYQLRQAENEAKTEGTNEAKVAWKKAKEQYDLKSLASIERRVKRFPNNLNYKFELGRALQQMDRTNEAIQWLQAAREVPSKQGECMLRLGQCFQKIKQYQLAMSHFEKAIQQISDRDADNKKIALYYAGRLALGLKDAEKAEKYLTSLAGIDFGYKDIGELLDKLAALRDNG
ncbi:MAG: hypothetical protein PVH19_05120 [Planctomycetia bacterium]|jgi:tetratricopeptide (TPR) repeat protein